MRFFFDACCPLLAQLVSGTRLLLSGCTTTSFLEKGKRLGSAEQQLGSQCQNDRRKSQTSGLGTKKLPVLLGPVSCIQIVFGLSENLCTPALTIRRASHVGFLL